MQGNYGLFFIFRHCMPPSRHHRTDFNLSVHITHGRRSETKQRCQKMGTDREADWNGEKRLVSVSYQQRACSPLPGFSYFLTLSLFGTFYQPNMWLFDIWGMRLNCQLSLWSVWEQLGQILLILPLGLIVFELYQYDVSFSFKQKCPSEGGFLL